MKWGITILLSVGLLIYAIHYAEGSSNSGKISYNYIPPSVYNMSLDSLPQQGELSVADQIKQVEPELADLLIRISWCESHYKYFTGEKDKDDIGWYQINQRYNPTGIECAMDLTCSTLFTANEIRAGRIWKWNASKWCWKKKFNNKSN